MRSLLDVKFWKICTLYGLWEFFLADGRIIDWICTSMWRLIIISIWRSNVELKLTLKWGHFQLSKKVDIVCYIDVQNCFLMDRHDFDWICTSMCWDHFYYGRGDSRSFSKICVLGSETEKNEDAAVKHCLTVVFVIFQLQLLCWCSIFLIVFFFLYIYISFSLSPVQYKHGQKG